MTTRFRIDAVSLDTTDGAVRYNFPSDLTVLAGKTGVGKTTLLELIKFGFGGNGVLADVARQHVNDVTLDVSLGTSRLRISRSLDAAKRNVARVTDLITRERMPDHNLDGRQPNLNSLLMNALGLPDDMRAAAQGGGSTRAGTRISFNDIFTFLYVPQSAINRDIAHSQETYREPTRRAVFELLFALTDAELLRMRSDANLLKGRIAEAEREYETVLAFLRDSNTTGREEAVEEVADARTQEADAEAELAALRDAVDPVSDRETQVLRDLLTEAERELAGAREIVVDLARQQAEYAGERRRVQTDLGRLQRMREAGERLADFEFLVCPRCMQSLTGRTVEEDSCRVCLQPDPVTGASTDDADRYEVSQLADQLADMDDHLYATATQLAATTQTVTDREQLVLGLTRRIDSRTAERVTPRLQAFSDAAARHATAQLRQDQLESVLRQWDRADDLGSVVSRLRAEREDLLARIDRSQRDLDGRRQSVLQSLSEEFEQAALTLGIPGVQTASINSSTYLPMLNGQSFTTFSPAGGGIVTATQIAYWTSLLTVALRDEEAIYPAFLLIDSPRLALNTAEALAAALYLRLVTQAGAEPGRVQIIVADNELPAQYRREYAEIDFSYDNPTISTVPHPGPAAVTTIGSGDDTGRPQVD